MRIAGRRLSRRGDGRKPLYGFAAPRTTTYAAPHWRRAPAAALEPQCHYFNRRQASKLFDSAGPDHASIAALAGLGEYFAAGYRHHFGESDPPLHEKALAVSALMHRHEAELCAPSDGLQSLRNGNQAAPSTIRGPNNPACAHTPID